jgi:hypothetical protein
VLEATTVLLDPFSKKVTGFASFGDLEERNPKIHEELLYDGENTEGLLNQGDDTKGLLNQGDDTEGLLYQRKGINLK